MKKLVIAGVVALSLVAGAASAQSYYPTYSSGYTTTPTYSSGSCVSISGYLSVGSRGSQVLALQQFLVSQDYPGSGTWMETGYFGTATHAALIDFQQSRGLPQTGVVDSATLSALVNCNGSSYAYPGYPGTTYPTYPTTTTYPYNYSNPTYPYNGGYNYSGSVAITSLSQNTGTPGQTITIYGQGFQPTNTVYFGGQAVQAYGSNGTSISFTIPYISSYSSNQTVNLYVTNSFGTSNTLTFTLFPSGYNTTCGTYPYTSGYNTCGCNSSVGYPYTSNCGCTTTYPYTSNCGTCGSTYTTYPYNNGCGAGNTNSPTITYINPQSGGVGATVTVYGSGFTTSNNTIHFGNGIITGLGSPDGQSLSFQVPSQITGYGSQPVILGNYNVSVTNSNNITSNAVTFDVTSTNGNGGNGAPTISSVSGPTNVQTNVQDTWTLNLINLNGSYTTVSVNWGDNNVNSPNQQTSQTVYNGNSTVTLTHIYYTSGTYTVTFTASNQYGQSNSYTETVVVSGSGVNSGNPTITSLAPNSGYVGSQVTIYGSNFSTSANNTIDFGINGAIQNVYSNGNSITFTVPSYTTPYCTPGLLCGVQPTQIVPGTYNVSVMDPYGTSNTLSFTVL